MDSTTSEILRVIVGAGVGTAIAQGCFTLYHHWRTRRSQAAFLAFQLAIRLEGYARSCRSRIDDAENYVSSRGAVGGPHFDLPNFPDLPDDTEGWRNINPQIMDYVFRLQADIESIQSSIQFLADEIGEPGAAFSDCVAGCAKIGLQARRVATSIRQHYGFAALDDDVVEGLERVHMRPEGYYEYLWQDR